MLLRHTRTLIGCILVLSVATTVDASDYDLSWYTIDAGGETFSTGGDFELGGTSGQPDASTTVMSGGDFELSGGFWPALTTGPALHPGDLDCDGDIDFDDIDAFVLALSGQAGYEAAYPDCNWMNADCNNDGTVDFDDIDAFVAILSGG